MNLRPLGDRVLIKPEKPSEQTESGLWLSEHRKPDECGTVVAVGECRHPLREEADAAASALEDHWYGTDDDDATVKSAANLIRELVAREPSVKVGDTVLFSWASGQEITIDDGNETYLLMRESDLLAVLEE